MGEPLARRDETPMSPADWAHVYRQHGIQIVPSYMPSEKKEALWKRPLGEWKKLQSGLVSDAAFNTWYGPSGEHRARQNMGIITGAASGGIFIIDLDTYKGSAAQDWWSGLLETHNNGRPLETPKQKTGGGGVQMLFRAPIWWSPPTCKTAIGVDVRGEGGFAVLPPSLHSSGQHYEWVEGFALTDVDIVTAPDWLCDEIKNLVAKHSSKERVTAPAPLIASNDNDPPNYPAPPGLSIGSKKEGREEYMRDTVKVVMQEYIADHRAAPTSDELYAIAWPQYQSGASAYVPGKVVRGEAEMMTKCVYALQRFNAGQFPGLPNVQAAVTAQAIKRQNEGGKPPVTLSASIDEAELGADPGPFSAGDFRGTAPARKWVVPEWIPAGTVTLLYGDGGVGKSLLALQLQYATAPGTPEAKWCGLVVPKLRSLGVYCEDDKEELQRRHQRICENAGHLIGNPYGGVTLWSRVGYENLIVTYDGKNGSSRTEFFDRVLTQIIERRIELLVLDTAADVFGGNEIVRAQVNHFIKAVCGRFILAAGRAGFVLTVLVLAHPSEAGMASGTGKSGSSGWSNAVRSRLYLLRPPGHEQSDERVLTKKKANYSKQGESIDLLWCNGVIVPQFDKDGTDESVAVRSAMAHIVRKVAMAWDDSNPYKAKESPAGRVLDRCMLDELGAMGVASKATQAALIALKNSGAIATGRKGANTRGWGTRAQVSRKGEASEPGD